MNRNYIPPFDLIRFLKHFTINEEIALFKIKIVSAFQK